MISVGSLQAGKGEKVQGLVRVGKENLELPVTIVRSRNEGKTLLLTGGVHNAEYVGIQTAIEFAEELHPEELASGSVIIVQLLNRTGFEHRTMSVVYEDGKNLNREFPGNPEGTLAERICAWVEKELFTKIDYYVDLHCGDGFEHLTPYVYYQGKASKEVSAVSKAMASVVNVPYMVKSSSDSGGAFNYAGKCGIPGILIERGSRGIWSREEVDLDKKDVKMILSKLHFLEEALSFPKTVPEEIEDVTYFSAPCGGCWYPLKNPGEQVEKGDSLGEIRDYFGNVQAKIEAFKKGRVLYQISSLCVSEGETLIAY